MTYRQLQKTVFFFLFFGITTVVSGQVLFRNYNIGNGFGDFVTSLELNAEGDVYACTENGLFSISDNKISHFPFKNFASNIFFPDNEEYFYAVPSEIGEEYEIEKLDTRTKKIKKIGLPKPIIAGELFKNKIISYGRVASNYDVITIENDIVKSFDEYFTYLKNGELLVSLSDKVQKKINGKFVKINKDSILFFEGIAINDQKNKLKGVFKLNDDLTSFEKVFPFLEHKIIRSLNYNKKLKAYYGATIDSLFVFTTDKIISKNRIPSIKFDSKGEVPFNVFYYNKTEVVIETLNKNDHQKSVYIVDFFKNTLISLNKRLNINRSNLRKVLVDKNSNIYLATKTNGLFCFFNAEDNYVNSHLFKDRLILKIREGFTNGFAFFEKNNLIFEDGTSPYDYPTDYLEIKNGKRYLTYNRDINSPNHLKDFNEDGYEKDNVVYYFGNYIDKVSDSTIYHEHYSLFYLTTIADKKKEKFYKNKIFNSRDVSIIDGKIYQSTRKSFYVYDLKEKQYISQYQSLENEIDFFKTFMGNSFFVSGKSDFKIIAENTQEIVKKVSHKFKVNDILIDDDLIWVATQDNGLLILNKELQIIRKVKDESKFLFVNDVIKKDNNQYYIATDNGALLLNKNKILNRQINNSVVGIEKNNDFLTLEYLDKTFPKIFNFEYKINDANWKDLDSDVLNVSHLSHGNHNISLRYIASKKGDFKEFYTKSFSVNKAWHQRPSILMIYGMIIMGIVIFWLTIFAKNQTKKKLYLVTVIKRKEELEKSLEDSQKAIAMDLHDNFGNRLAGINVTASILKEIKEQHVESDENFNKFLNHLDDGISKLNIDIQDFLWANNPKNNAVALIFERLEGIVYDFEETNDVSISCDTFLDKDYNLPSFWSRQLLLIFKESLHNAVKHSQTKEVKIILKAENENLIISCQDFGLGFDLEDIKRKSGLLNMKKRARSIDCKLDIISEVGEGTTIVFSGKIE